MTTTSPTPTTGTRWYRTLPAVSALLIAVVVVSPVGLRADDHTITSGPGWHKPFKFGGLLHPLWRHPRLHAHPDPAR
ncbi:hypothetical protein [Umezawaea tangerina]|uniref:Uncharacterized protein n=1 Tax=Umezawaea tangerina TaxID=84725 RepID=A0A2T0T7T3_9PSEU|nr:hypothetical protein [Umezawaea tangerina]PRY41730.1 hypothetical protein CLV43_105489 [Umezawaea tangerina]